MPTKSNNIGGQGGKRPGAGRKAKPLNEKLASGNPGGRTVKVLDIPELDGLEMPKPSDYLSTPQRDGADLCAVKMYEDMWSWLKTVGCVTIVPPYLVESYAMCAARWIQCQEAISSFGHLSKHPTTGKPIQSPFVAMAATYLNQTLRTLGEITQIVKENCATEYSAPPNPQNELMERLLQTRKG